MISAVAIAPPTEVEHVFETFSGSVRGELQPVMAYFEDNFIGRPTGRGRRQARIPVELWNHHETELRAGFMTTNTAEAWHRGFQAHVQCCNPNLWWFLGVLHRDESLQLHRLGQLEMGERYKPDQKYAKVAERVKALAESYNNRQAMTFLRGVARNIAH
ncbi:uncharacterized protein LOC144148285 [Haemaphysalis longicornis]